MKVWVYSIIHNEAPMLGYFMRHYLTVADRVILYDDHSTDGGPELAQRLGAEVRPYPGYGLDDIHFVEFAAETYPEARGQADWVMWPDADEFVWHPYLLMTLGRYMASGVTLPLIDGWQLYSPVFPTTTGQIYDEVKSGTRWGPQCKRLVFNPAINVRWGAGKHSATSPDGVDSQQAEIRLLHCRHLGREWYQARNSKNYGHMTERNIAAGLGSQVYPQNQDKHGWQTQFVPGTELTQVVP